MPSSYTPYATMSDFIAWMGLAEVPVNAAPLLRSAGLLVARALLENLYNPTTTHDDARRDATCAQAAAWAGANIDPTAGPAGLAGLVKSKSIGTGSITYDVPSAADREAAIRELAPDALNILTAAQLLYAPVPTWSDLPDPGLFVDELGHVGGYSSYGIGYPGTNVPFGWRS